MVSSSYLSSLPHSLTHSLTDPTSRPTSQTYLTDLPHRPYLTDPTSLTLAPHSLTDLSSLPHSLTHRVTHRRTRGAGGGRDTLTKALQQGHGDWGFFLYKKGSISIQDIIIYHLISCRYHNISLCIISSIMIYHVPRRIMIYRDIIFFPPPCDIMSISCHVLDDTWT